MVALRTWRPSFASNGFGNAPNDRAFMSVYIKDALTIGVSSKLPGACKMMEV